MRSLLLASLALPAAGRFLVEDEAAQGSNPMVRIVKLLKEMSAQLDAEAAKDEEMADKLQ